MCLEQCPHFIVVFGAQVRKIKYIALNHRIRDPDGILGSQKFCLSSVRARDYWEVCRSNPRERIRVRISPSKLEVIIDGFATLSAAMADNPECSIAVEAWIRRIVPNCSFKLPVHRFWTLGLGAGNDQVRRGGFGSRFPDFLAKESPLLDQYRRQILTRGIY